MLNSRWGSEGQYEGVGLWKGMKGQSAIWLSLNRWLSVWHYMGTPTHNTHDSCTDFILKRTHCYIHAPWSLLDLLANRLSCYCKMFGISVSRFNLYFLCFDWILYLNYCTPNCFLFFLRVPDNLLVVVFDLISLCSGLFLAVYRHNVVDYYKQLIVTHYNNRLFLKTQIIYIYIYISPNYLWN